MSTPKSGILVRPRAVRKPLITPIALYWRGVGSRKAAGYMSQSGVYFLTMVTGHRGQPSYRTRVEYRRLLTDIFVGKLVRQADTLGLMLDRFAIHDSVLELFYDGFVDRVTLGTGQLAL